MLAVQACSGQPLRLRQQKPIYSWVSAKSDGSTRLTASTATSCPSSSLNSSSPAADRHAASMTPALRARTAAWHSTSTLPPLSTATTPCSRRGAITDAQQCFQPQRFKVGAPNTTADCSRIPR
jgi:hypothetical protein